MIVEQDELRCPRLTTRKNRCGNLVEQVLDSTCYGT